MKIRMAQYGVSHDHAAGKAHVLRDSDDVDLAGVFEPSTQVRETLGASQEYSGVRWLLSKQEMLEDDTIDAIAVEGRVSENLDFAREALEHDKHVWLDKPAGDDLAVFREILELAAERAPAMRSSGVSPSRNQRQMGARDLRLIRLRGSTAP